MTKSESNKYAVAVVRDGFFGWTIVKIGTRKNQQVVAFECNPTSNDASIHKIVMTGQIGQPEKVIGSSTLLSKEISQNLYLEDGVWASKGIAQLENEGRLRNHLRG